jgi:hypothetical protein
MPDQRPLHANKIARQIAKPFLGLCMTHLPFENLVGQLPSFIDASLQME